MSQVVRWRHRVRALRKTVRAGVLYVPPVRAAAHVSGPRETAANALREEGPNYKGTSQFVFNFLLGDVVFVPPINFTRFGK